MDSMISLDLKCPNCGTFLMDEEHPIDNFPSVALRLKFENKDIWIRLSSLYGSYNLESEEDIPEGQVCTFYCPHCKKDLPETAKCSLCASPLVSLFLDVGGKVNFCSKRGCTNHSLEFLEISSALLKFYQKFGYARLEKMGIFIPSLKKKEKPKDQKEIIRTGTFLQSFCPYCKTSLIEDNKIILKVINNEGEQGLLKLSPYLNFFTHESTIDLPAKKTVKDLRCPHCDHTLIEEGKSCEVCGSPAAIVLVNAMHKLINFYICLKKGCEWHGLSDEDVDLIMLEDSTEW